MGAQVTHLLLLLHPVTLFGSGQAVNQLINPSLQQSFLLHKRLLIKKQNNCKLAGG